MNTLLKTLLITTAPALAAAAPAEIPAPATQPAPTTQPAPAVADSNAPLVIPDGTSIENPGPAFAPQQGTLFFDGIREGQLVKGLRG